LLLWFCEMGKKMLLNTREFRVAEAAREITHHFAFGEISFGFVAFGWTGSSPSPFC